MPTVDVKAAPRSALTDNRRLMAAASVVTATRVLTEISRLKEVLNQAYEEQRRLEDGEEDSSYAYSTVVARVNNLEGQITGLRYAASVLAGSLLLGSWEELNDWLAER